MNIKIHVSHFGRMGNPWAVFWTRRAEWYRPPRLGFRGERGRFLIGFNLYTWVIRVSATWRP